MAYRVRPSGSDKVLHCPASLQMQELFTGGEETQEAKDGTACHWVASSVLESYQDPNSGLLLSDYFLNKPAPNGVVITEEMIEAVDVYTTHVLQVAGEFGLMQQLKTEQSIQIPRIHPTECGGTPDNYLWDGSRGVLSVWDFKFGHSFVDVFENTQLIEYAIGILDIVTGGNAMLDESLRIDFYIIQPRCYNGDGVIRKWTVKSIDLRAIVNVMIAQTSLALKPNPPSKSGSHCKNCTALSNCGTALNACNNAIDYNDRITIEVIPPDQLKAHRAQLIAANDTLKNRLKAIETEIETLISNNVDVAGLKLDNKKGRLEWSNSDQEIKSLGELLNVKLTKEVCVTPTQAKKIIDPSLVEAYASIKSGGSILVDSDTTKANLVFGKKKVYKHDNTGR